MVTSTIKEYRKLKKVSITELANAVNVSRDTIMELEKGKGKIQVLTEVCKYLGVSLELVISGSGDDGVVKKFVWKPKTK